MPHCGQLLAIIVTLAGCKAFADKIGIAAVDDGAGLVPDLDGDHLQAQCSANKKSIQPVLLSVLIWSKDANSCTNSDTISLI